jgi:hypothetical protein
MSAPRRLAYPSRRSRLDRRRQRASRTVLSVILTATAVLAAASSILPAATSSDTDMSHSLSISARPVSPSSYDGAKSDSQNRIGGTHLTIELSQDLSFAQWVGLAERELTVTFSGRWLKPVQSAADPNLSWELFVPGATHMRVIEIDTNTAQTESQFSIGHQTVFGEWEEVQSNGWIRPQGVTTVSNYGTEGMVAVHQLIAQVRLPAPAVSRGQTDGRWVESWVAHWVPAKLDSNLRWTFLEAMTGDEVDILDIAEDLATGSEAGGVQILACPSCRFIEVYGDGERLSRDTAASIGFFEESHAMEISVDWIPTNTLAPLGTWLWSSAAAAIIALAISEAYFFRNRGRTNDKMNS